MALTLDTALSSQISSNDVTVAVVLPLPREAVGAQTVFVDGEGFDISLTPQLGFICSLCQIPSIQKGAVPHVVALAQPTRTGNNHAAICVTRLAITFPNLRAVVLCGIAGGAPTTSDPDRNVFLGDVVIASGDGVLQYDFGHVKRRSGQGGSSLESGRSAIAPDDVFLNISNQLATLQLRGEAPWSVRLESRMPHLLKLDSRFARPTSGDEIHRYTEIVGGGTARTIDRTPERDYPRLFTGAIGSANCVLKDPYRRDELRDGKPKVLAVEMEGSGVADACRAAGLKFTVVRGICDYCDEHKKDHWQFNAAAVAAAVAYCVIQRLPQELPRVSRSSGGPRGDATDLYRIGQLGVPEGAHSASAIDVPRRQRSPDEERSKGSASQSVSFGTSLVLESSSTSSASSATLDQMLRDIRFEEGRRNWERVFAIGKKIEKTVQRSSRDFTNSERAKGLYEAARAYITWSNYAPEERRKKLRKRAENLADTARKLL